MRLDFTKFYPLPVRDYDINRFRSYIDHVMEKERECIPSWHCFAIYNDDLIQQIRDYIEEEWGDCEYYAKDILECNLIENLYNEERSKYVE